jgi:hypothetical protein
MMLALWRTIMATVKTSKAAPAVKRASVPVKALSVPAVSTAAILPTADSILFGVEELLDFSKANAEAALAAGQNMAVGLQGLAHSLVEWSKESYDQSLRSSQALATVKNFEDAVDLSQTLAKTGLETVLHESSRLGSLSAKLVEGTIAPLQGRVIAVVEQFKVQHAT